MAYLEGDDRFVGTQGWIYFGDIEPADPWDDMPGADAPEPQGFALPMRAWSMAINRSIRDLTTSTHYSDKYGQVFSCGIQTAVSAEAKVDGTFRLHYVPNTVLRDLFDGEALSHVTFGLDDITVFCEGMFLVSNFVIQSPIDDAVSFSCTLKSQGVLNFSGILRPEG